MDINLYVDVQSYYDTNQYKQSYQNKRVDYTNNLESTQSEDSSNSSLHTPEELVNSRKYPADLHSLQRCTVQTQILPQEECQWRTGIKREEL